MGAQDACQEIKEWAPPARKGLSTPYYPPHINEGEHLFCNQLLLARSWKFHILLLLVFGGSGREIEDSMRKKGFAV